MRRRWPLIAVKFLVFVILFLTIVIAGFGNAVLHLWNWLMPSLFGLHPITFWQAVGLLALSWILFGGWRGFHGPGYGKRWRQWTPEERRSLPEQWPPPGERRRAADGSEYRLRSRAVEIDPLDQRLALEMLAEKWVDDRPVATEEHSITIRMYFRDELVMMLERAGFTDIDVRGGYTDAEPTPDHEYLVFHARRP